MTEIDDYFCYSMKPDHPVDVGRWSRTRGLCSSCRNPRKVKVSTRRTRRGIRV